MLKIYLQIFGPIAICLIIFLNYNVFIQKPQQEEMQKVRRELRQIQDQNKVLESVLEFRPRFKKLEELQFQDYLDVNVFFSDLYNEPLIMQKIQKMIELSGCSNNGIIVGRVTNAARRAQYNDFKTSPKEDLSKSVDAFLTTMNTHLKDPKKEQLVMGPESNYASRLLFYQPMSQGKQFPRTMARGIEVRRFNFTAKGTYTECKKLLWLISENRPFTQALILSFQPISKDAQGPDKKFELRLVVMVYVDRNGRMIQSEPVAETQG